jgi:hypothetical protein
MWISLLKSMLKKCWIFVNNKVDKWKRVFKLLCFPQKNMSFPHRFAPYLTDVDTHLHDTTNTINLK